MIKLLEEFKKKVDEIIKLKILINNEAEKFKSLKKDDVSNLTIGEYKQKVDYLINLQESLKDKVDNVNKLHETEIGNCNLQFLLELMSSVFGTKMQQQNVKSIYYKGDYDLHFREMYFEKAQYNVIAPKDFNAENISQEQLIQMIKNKKCILIGEIKDLYKEEREYSKIKSILEPYRFKTDMLSEKPSFYETLYPNLRQKVWEILNDNYVKKLQSLAKGYKSQIINAEQKLKNSEQILKIAVEQVINKHKEEERKLKLFIDRTKKEHNEIYEKLKYDGKNLTDVDEENDVKKYSDKTPEKQDECESEYDEMDYDVDD